MSLGEQTAAEILKHLGPKEVQRLGTAMAQLVDVQRDEVEIVLSNFMDEARSQTGLGMGASESDHGTHCDTDCGQVTPDHTASGSYQATRPTGLAAL